MQGCMREREKERVCQLQDLIRNKARREHKTEGGGDIKEGN